VLGYDQPILGYNSNGWNLVEGSLIECIRDGYENFFVLILIHLFWLWNCIDFTFWMTVRAAVDYSCNLTATILFWFIEQIIEPNITVDTTFTVLFWFISPPLLVLNLLSAILPVFNNYKSNYQSSILRTPRCCSSGRHSRRGKQSNRNHVSWHGQLYHSIDPKKLQQRTHLQQEKQLRHNIELTDYQDVIRMPPSICIYLDEVYYDVADQPPDWIPPNSVQSQPSLAITSDTINSLIDNIDVLSYHQATKSFEKISFFNSNYSLLDPTSILHSRILIQARHLKSQVFHYDTTFDNCTDTTTAIYVSSRDDEPPVVIDTGASGSITPLGSDFEDGIINQADLQELKQVNGSTPVCGQGIVNWDIEDVDGTQRILRTEAYYVPDAGIRLFSPQVYIGNNKTARLLIDHTGILFTLKCGSVMRFPFNKSNNLPFMLTKNSLQSRRKSHLLSYVNTLTSKSIFNSNSLIDRSVFNRDNFNLNPSQLELLKWHCRWCHCDLNRVRMILSKPQQPKGSSDRGEIIPQMVVPMKTGTTTCGICICTACQYAKQKRKTPDSSVEIKNDELEGALTAGDLYPGDKVSCDQYMSPSKGRLQHTKGAESSSKQYVGGTIFIDHATNYVFNNHQTNLTAESTIESKHLCESKFDEFGVQIHQFHADNHPFRSKVWVADCAVQQQLPTSHSGVGAHHQVLAERQIQTTFNWSRANLLHFVLHWPQMAKNCENLWPYAVDYAVYMHNHLPIREMRMSPVEKFTGTVFSNYNHLIRAHTFGCPVYVLDPRLQDSKKIPKWKMRSRRGIYLGVSKHHSSTVHLILNPETGAISPQYHCIFDDTFSTVWSDGVFDYNVWECLVKTVDRHHSIEPNSEGEVTLPPDFSPFSDDINENIVHHENQNRSPTFRQQNNNNNNNNDITQTQEIDQKNTIAPHGTPLLSRHIFNPPPTPSSSSSPISSIKSPVTQEQPRRSTRSNFGNAPEILDPSNHHITNYTSALPNTTPTEHYCNSLGIKLPSATRGRTVSQGGPLRTSYTSEKQNLPKVQRNQLNAYYLTCIDWSKFINVLTTGITTLDAFSCELRKNITYENGIKILEYFNPAMLITVINKEDNPTLKEAMNGPDASGFIKAMETEINTLITMQAFVVVDKERWMNVVSSVWAFKRKRYPDGSIRKLKARICARGFEQIEGVDYFETFAPVVQWMTVRVVLIMTILLHLENKQIDYTAAFLQAPIDHDVYVEMPKLFSVKGKVWKLKRAIYGLKDAPRAYFLHTKNKLEDLGFRQSDADPCLFISPTVICLIYVDDALFVYKSPEEVDILTKKMKAIGMLFEEESDVAGYLGVLIDRDPDNDTITLRQSGLAQRIVEALHLDDNTTPVKTPAEAFLPLDEDGESAHEIYNYASVAGMLQYLQGHSRPDISFAVSQISRYTFGPKRSHELALERIGRYLKGTIDGGLILKPNLKESTFKIDVYVDAAFASGWGTEQGTNPDSVKSRTGFIIEVMGCAVLWCSKLQPCIATSTMESEYTALSMALRAAIPLIEITKAINTGLNFTTTKLLTFKATVHEDNMGALRLSKLEPGRNTPRSKFYALKLHWFRSWLIPREIEIVHCATKDQKADYLTKPLGPTMFKACRLLSMGW
jgi:hypothetical protein